MVKINMSNIQEEIEKAKQLIGANKIEEAINLLEDLKEIASFNFDIFFELGKSYYILNNNKKAYDNLKISCGIKQDNVYSKMLLAKTLERLGKEKQALKIFRELEKKGIEEAKINVIRVLINTRKYETAYKYIISNFKEEYYKYLDSCLFNINLDKLSDVELLTLEQIYLNLLKNIKNISVWDIEIKLAKIYYSRNINFIYEKKFINSIYNKVNSHTNVVLKKFYNNVLNLLEKKANKIFLRSKPMKLSVQLTTKCNAKCKFCDVYNDNWELPNKTYKEIIDLMPMLVRVCWWGGEVFLYKKFKTLFNTAKKFGVKQEIITNAMLLTEDWLKEIITSETTLGISIRSTEKAKYEYLTQGAKFDKLISVLKYLKDHKRYYNKNFKLLMFVLITKYNYMEMEKLIEFANDYGFEGVSFIQLDNIEQSSKSYNIFNTNNKIYKDVVAFFNKALALANKCGIRIISELPLNVQNKEFEKNKKMNGEKKLYIMDGKEIYINDVFEVNNLICSYPWEELQIYSGGYTFFDCLCPRYTPLGNIEKQTIMEIWNSKDSVDFRKKIIDGNNKDICNSLCVSGYIYNK